MISIAGDAIAGAIIGFWNAKKVGDQLRLHVSLVWSFILSGSFSMGTALFAGAGITRSLGTGLIVGSSMATVLWRSSPLARGMQLALPADEAARELDINRQVISK